MPGSEVEAQLVRATKAELLVEASALGRGVQADAADAVGAAPVQDRLDDAAGQTTPPVSRLSPDAQYDRLGLATCVAGSRHERAQLQTTAGHWGPVHLDQPSPEQAGRHRLGKVTSDRVLDLFLLWFGRVAQLQE